MAASASEATAHIIKADLLIPGRGDPITNGAVVYVEDRIVYAGQYDEIPEKYSQADTVHVPVVMPGMWDCHIHFQGHHVYSIEHMYQIPKALAGARSARDVAATLDAGFTSCREMCGFGLQLAQAIKEGALVGPNIYSAGSFISPTAGHADAHGVHIDHFTHSNCNGGSFQLCDGVDECLKGVRLQLRKGAKVIKICASGGIASEEDNPEHQQFSDEEISAIVGEATRSGRLVAAHCHGKVGIMAALRAGVSTIEHGTYLDEESIQIMMKQGAILVATRAIIEAGLELSKAWSAKSLAKLQHAAPAHKKAYAMAVKAGVTIALGSDLGISYKGNGGTLLDHGRNGLELRYAVQAGMTPLEAIEAATANGPLTLGPQAPLSGQLKEGYDADFIALSRNPLEDIEVFSESKNITHVWRAGKVYKEPGKAVGFPDL
jgi:imidazolonepropionase-like amidohydrolase